MIRLFDKIARRILVFRDKAVCRLRVRAARAKGVALPNSVSIGSDVEIDPAGGRVSIGAGTTFDKGVILRAYGGHITMGRNCSVNPYSVLYGHGGLTIGDGVRIAAHVVIIPANHKVDDTQQFIYEQGETTEGIVIESDVWIGAGARILDGVTLARGTVVAAGAVVTRSTEPYGIYGGVPARKIRMRGAKQR